jgi:hypothetical protein
MGWLQVDHIYPVVKGGTDDLDNLCLACELCNQYKWTKVDGVDPLTGEVSPLYHPRKMRWTDHFVWSSDGTRLIGQTVCGRATVEALRLNNPLAIAVRRNWIIAGWHPPTVT